MSARLGHLPIGRCQECGGPTLLGDGSPECHNDACSLNVEAHRVNDIAESIGVAIGWALLAAKWAVVAAVVYAAWRVLS